MNLRYGHPQLAADRILELLDQRGMLEGVTW